MSDAPHAELELRLRGPYESIAEACAGVRARIRRSERWRGAFWLLLFAVLAAAVLLLAGALLPDLIADAPPRSVMLLGVLVLLSLAAPLYALITHGAARAIERRKLELAEHLLEVFGAEIPDKEMILELSFHGHHRTRPKKSQGGTAHYEHEWLRLAFVLLNDTSLGVRCQTRAERWRAGSALRERAHETLRVSLKLPNDDLFGPTRPEVTVSPPAGLSVETINVQGQAVLFYFRTSEVKRSRKGATWDVSGLDGRLDREKVTRAIEACRESVAGLRTFSQPPCHPPREPGRSPRRPRRTLAELLGRLWRSMRPRGGLDAYLSRHEATIHEVSEGITSELEVDLHPSAPGIREEDLAWIERAISHNLWEWRARHQIIGRSGWMQVGPTRDLSQLGVKGRVSMLLAAVRPDARRPVRLKWDPSAPTFPKVFDDRVRLVLEQPGVWLGVHEASIVATTTAPGDTPRVVTKLPANFDPERHGALAYDPRRKVIGLWMRCWARDPSRTFFWSHERGDWTEHRHPFRPEDEHAGSSFLFDFGRDAFVRLGVTYRGIWSEEEEYVEQPAGLMQLALSAKGRLAVSDPDTKTTLVVDLVEGRVVKSAPSGWALVAEIEPSEDLEDHPHPWSILAKRYRYDTARKWLLWEARIMRRWGLALDLAPAFERAASLD